MCRALQLNIPWPDTNQVAKIQEQHLEMKTVFQASNNLLADNTTEQLVNGICGYGDAIGYVFIDPSGGRGMPFDLESSIVTYLAVHTQLPELMIGFCGWFHRRKRYSKAARTY